jgi:hypothetical protein
VGLFESIQSALLSLRDKKRPESSIAKRARRAKRMRKREGQQTDPRAEGLGPRADRQFPDLALPSALACLRTKSVENVKLVSTGHDAHQARVCRDVVCRKVPDAITSAQVHHLARPARRRGRRRRRGRNEPRRRRAYRRSCCRRAWCGYCRRARRWRRAAHRARRQARAQGQGREQGPALGEGPRRAQPLLACRRRARVRVRRRVSASSFCALEG